MVSTIPRIPVPRTSAASHLPASDSIPSIPSEGDPAMANYLRYPDPSQYTPPPTSFPLNPPPPRSGEYSPPSPAPRPLEPRRSRASGGPSQGRASTGTWISSSQWKDHRRPAPQASEYDYDPQANYSQARSTTPHPYDYAADPYLPPGSDVRAPSAPATEAEHMTVDVDTVPGDLPPEPDGPSTRPRSAFGGMLRKIMGKDKPAPQSTYDFAPGVYADRESEMQRDVTYVDTGGAIMPDETGFIPSRSGTPALHRAVPGGLDPAQDDDLTPEDAEPRDSTERTAAGTHSSHGRDLDGTTAAHHGPPHAVFSNPPMPHSPVYLEPLPTSDYDKMSAFHTAPSEMHSLLSYVDRVTQFLQDLHDLPWMSSRVAADYIPGESSRSRYQKFKQRHPHGEIALTSWYANTVHQDVDLLEGERSDIGATWGAVNQGGIPEGYRNMAYVYPATYPGQYAPPDHGYGDGYAASEGGQEHDPARVHSPRPEGGAGPEGADVPSRGPTPASPRPGMHAHSHSGPSHTPERSTGWSSDVRVHVQSAGTPPPPVAMHQVPTNGGLSVMSPRTDRTDRTLHTVSHTAHSVASPRTNATRGSLTFASDSDGRSARATTAYETARERATPTALGSGGRTDEGRSSSDGARPRPSANGSGDDKKRRSRVSWYSSSDGHGTPTNGTRPLSSFGGSGMPGSLSPPGSPRASRYTPAPALSSMSGSAVGSGSGSALGSGSGSGRRGGSSRRGPARSPEMAQIREHPDVSPVQYAAVPVDIPASPPRSAVGMGSPRRNRYEYQQAAYDGRERIPFAIGR